VVCKRGAGWRVVGIGWAGSDGRRDGDLVGKTSLRSKQAGANWGQSTKIMRCKGDGSGSTHQSIAAPLLALDLAADSTATSGATRTEEV
jgi:hypothetical protein